MKSKVILIFLFIFQGSIFDTINNYSLIDYKDIKNLVNEIKFSNFYNSIIKIENVFKKYKNIRAPLCKSENEKQCKSYLFEVSNFEKGEDYVKSLPTIFILAGIHGNEVTGTNAIYYFLKFLLNYFSRNKKLENILNNVRILFLPTSNINGFDNVNREERINNNFFDPNRDFPFNQKEENKCLLTSTGKIINEIFINNMIVACLTFHGGETSITYPWGAPSHSENPQTADQNAFYDVAEMLKNIAASNINKNIENPNINQNIINKNIHNSDFNENIKNFNQIKNQQDFNKIKNIPVFETGTMHDVVYDVNGGFEDWAYGASWDFENQSLNCNNKQTIYNDYSNRCFIFLVEASTDKIPNEEDLGNEQGILGEIDFNSWGHVSRNIVMMIGFFEIINPFIEINKILVDDIISVFFEIKGCVEVDEIILEISDYKLEFLKKNYSGHIFFYRLDIFSKLKKNNLKIKARCDSKWKNDEEKPQSHFVNMKTDPDYNKEFNGYKIKSSYYIIKNISNIKKKKYLKNSFNIFDFSKTLSLIIYENNLINYDKEKKLSLEYNKNGIIFKINFDLKNRISKFVLKNIDFNNFVIEISKYGKFKLNNNLEKTKYIIKKNKKLILSKNNFIDLIGRNIKIIFLNSKKTIFESPLQFSNLNKDSFLPVPENGMFFYKKIKENNFFFNVENKKTFIEIILYTNKQNNFYLLINKKKFYLKEYNISKKIFSYKFIMRTEEENFFLRGRKINFFIKNKKNFEFYLNLKNFLLNKKMIKEILSKDNLKENKFFFIFWFLLLAFIVVIINKVYFIRSEKRNYFIELKDNN